MKKRRQRQAGEHYRRRLQSATDGAITAATLAQLAEPVTDLHVLIPLRVSVGDVLARAQQDGLEVPRSDAAAMLRERLKFRGLAGWADLCTDAFDDPEPESGSR